jgi:hypothetical protein
MLGGVAAPTLKKTLVWISIRIRIKQQLRARPGFREFRSETLLRLPYATDVMTVFLFSGRHSRVHPGHRG